MVVAISPTTMVKSELCLTFALVLCGAASAQTFEVASDGSFAATGRIFSCQGDSGGPGSSDPGRITCDHMNLRSLLMRAYDLKTYQVSGPWNGPRIPATILWPRFPRGTTKEQVLVMWQHLLAERLQLTVHRETEGSFRSIPSRSPRARTRR